MAINRGLIRQATKRYEDKKRSYFKLQKGKNILRLMPFEHVVSEHDVKAGRFEEELLGTKIEHFFVDVERLWRGREFVNCLLDREACPLWQDYWNRPADTRKDYRPRPVFAVNAINMEEPHRGVQVITLNPSIFSGERDNQGRKVGIGILDYFNGFDPSASDDEQDEDEEVEGMVAGSITLPKVPMIGDAMLGLRGRDIIIRMKEGKIGKAVILQPDNEGSRAGAVALRVKDKCDALDKHFLRGVKDLFNLPEYFPGYASGGEGKFLWPVAIDFVHWLDEQSGEEKPRRGTADKSGTSDDEDEEVESFGSENTEVAEDTEDTEEEETGKIDVSQREVDKDAGKGPKVRKRSPRKPKVVKLEKGAKVVCLDMFDGDGNKLPKKDWRQFKGVFQRLETTTEGVVMAVVTLPLDMQDDEDILAELTANAEEAPQAEIDAGGPYYDFPQDCVQLLQE